MSLWPKTIYKVLVMAPQSLTYLGPHRVAYVSHSGTENRMMELRSLATGKNIMTDL